MSILAHFINAFASILLNKMRSGLSMLGIIIGVSSVIIMIAIGDSAQKSIVSTVQSLGSNLLTITPGSQQSSNARAPGGGGSSNVLTLEQVNAISEMVPGVSAITPQQDARKQVVYMSNNTNTRVTGVTSNYGDVRNFHVQYGQFISDEDNLKSTHVAVLGSITAQTLFQGVDPIGKDITIGNWIFTIKGVMETKGSQGFQNADDVVFIPLTTGQKIIFGSIYLSSIYISVTDETQMASVKLLVGSLLNGMLKITEKSKENYTIQNQADALSAVSSITGILKMFLGGIAAISLIVGGIGVMNIMLVSVTERIREIGIRKALGATRYDILMQFLTEALVLSTLGGLIGLGLSALVIFILGKLEIFNASISSSSVMLSIGFSAGIGIVFGILPAWKAGNLKPIDALRFE